MSRRRGRAPMDQRANNELSAGRVTAQFFEGEIRATSRRREGVGAPNRI